MPNEKRRLKLVSDERVIIGMHGDEGFPISAPAVELNDYYQKRELPQIRWVCRADSTYGLECFDVMKQEWVEIPCVTTIQTNN